MVEYAVVQGCVTLKIPVMVRSADVNAKCIADCLVKADSSCIVHVHVEPRLGCTSGSR